MFHASGLFVRCTNTNKILKVFDNYCFLDCSLEITSVKKRQLNIILRWTLNYKKNIKSHNYTFIFIIFLIMWLAPYPTELWPAGPGKRRTQLIHTDMVLLGHRGRTLAKQGGCRSSRSEREREQRAPEQMTLLLIERRKREGCWKRCQMQEGQSATKMSVCTWK